MLLADRLRERLAPMTLATSSATPLHCCPAHVDGGPKIAAAQKSLCSCLPALPEQASSLLVAGNRVGAPAGALRAALRAHSFDGRPRPATLHPSGPRP